MIRAIFFDLDGTIRHNEPRGSDVFAGHAARLGLRVRDDDLLRAMRWEHYYWANSLDLSADRARFDGDEAGFWTHYSQRQLIALGASPSQAADMARPMHAYMLDSFKPRSIVPSELPAALTALRDAGIPLGVISNRSTSFQDELVELGLAPFFAYSLAAGEIDAWKPEPGIFLHACRHIEVQPDHAAYVGDNYFADVVGARNAGLIPVLHDPRGIFDDPECAVIRSFTELPQALGIQLAGQPPDGELRGAL
jgi:putative hydrolase of the HAD superfamily